MQAVLNRPAKEKYLEVLKLKCEKKRREKVKDSRVSFWSYCQTLAPDFYLSNRQHLIKLCNTLQDFYQGKLINQKTGEPYRKIIIEMPPRHGKTRTLILFCSWVLGQDKTFKIITASYNDDLATDFSKFTRNTIAEERNTESQIIYSDIFSDSKIKYGDASYHQWALEGQYFNFKSCGIGGTITGKGGNMLIVDDPVKSAEEAFNEGHLDKINLWYTGTWISRMEEAALEIVNHTPWAKKDISGRLQAGVDKDKWFVLSMPACVEGIMLCPELLSKNSYDYLSRNADPIIFDANYNMVRVDVKGLLYGTRFKTYEDFPRNNEGQYLKRKSKGYCDVADQGEDYLCHIHYDRCGDYTFITDVYYTKDDVTITEPAMAANIQRLNVDEDLFEANGGGHAVAMHVKGYLDNARWFKTEIRTKDQRKNKESRILSNAHIVLDKILMPVGWEYKWPEFYKAVTSFMKEGKNKNDDGPDCLTGIAETEYPLVKWGLA